MLADEVDYVIGVDTHRDQHVLAVVAAPTGAVVAERVGATNARGYARRCGSLSDSRRARVSGLSKGAGHYGAGFARHLARPRRDGARESAARLVASGG